jgi:hypothetical protein
MHTSKTYRSRLFRDFKALPQQDHRGMVRYFEAHEKAILELDFEEYFELVVAYTNSCFEIGSYQKHLLMADVVVEAAIRNNIVSFNGEDVYYNTLFRKAASHYNLHEDTRAEYILRELIKINPRQSETILFLGKCLRKQRPRYVQHCRAAAMFCFLAAPLIFILEILVVEPFYMSFDKSVEYLRNGVFGAGWFLLIGSDVWHRGSVNREVHLFVKKVLRREKPSGKQLR